MTAKNLLELNQMSVLNLSVLAFSIALIGCTKPVQPKSVIEQLEPEIKTIQRKDVETNLQRKPPDHESAQTDWIFSVVPELDFDIKVDKKESNGYRVGIELTGVRLKLALPIKIMIDEKAPQSIVEHENGHVQICKRVYSGGKAYAQSAVDAAVGKSFEGFGANRKQALSSALQQAAQEVAAPYRGKTAVLAEAVSSRYDQLCEKKEYDGHIQKAIEDAFAQVRKEVFVEK